MKLFLTLVALALFAAGPAFAQLHERGVARTGPVQSTTIGGNAFMCRLACSLETGCAGWNWTRGGEDGPQSRCELLAGVTDSTPDTCCNSGLNERPRPAAAAPSASSAALLGDQYAPRSQTPAGPPVELAGDPTGGIWQDDAGAEEETAEEDAGEADAELAAEEEDDARFESMGQAEAPTVTTPTARITSGPTPRSTETPRYSVQQEYRAAPLRLSPEALGAAGNTGG